MSGNTALVVDEAPNEVSVYRRASESSCAWWFEAVFQPSPTDVASSCGMGSDITAISLDGNLAAIGWLGDGNVGYGKCAGVEIYRRSGNVWTLEATLGSVNFGTSHLGRDVAIQGTTRVASASTGVYVFEESGGSWNLVAQFPTVGGIHSVALDGNRFVTGDANISVNGFTFAGEALVYERNSNGWLLAQTLHPSDQYTQHFFFGRDVDIDGNTIVIGTGGYNPVHAAYVFSFDGIQWVEQQKLLALSPGPTGYFGGPVVVRGDTVLVGHAWDDSVAQGAGAVYHYERSGATWTLQPLITASDGAAGDGFGIAVDVDLDPNGDPVILVGTYDVDSVNSNFVGAAYVYSPCVSPPPIPEIQLVADILGGVTQGGGGIIILPGSGPIPVDPDPYLPVITVVYEDSRSMENIARGLIAEYPSRMPIATTKNVRDVLSTPETLRLLIPDNEVTALEEIVGYRDKLHHSLQVPVVLFLEDDGDGFRYLKKLIEKGVWK